MPSVKDVIIIQSKMHVSIFETFILFYWWGLKWKHAFYFISKSKANQHLWSTIYFIAEIKHTELSWSFYFRFHTESEKLQKELNQIARIIACVCVCILLILMINHFKILPFKVPQFDIKMSKTMCSTLYSNAIFSTTKY